MLTKGMLMNPKYPIYIVSKGRWESRLTSKALERMNVPYRIIVEQDEFDREIYELKNNISSLSKGQPV